MNDIEMLKSLFYQFVLATEKMRARLEELKQEESNQKETSYEMEKLSKEN